MDRSAGQQRANAVLLTLQVALTVILLAGAAIFQKSYLALTRVPLGFEPSNAVAARMLLERSPVCGGRSRQRLRARRARAADRNSRRRRCGRRQQLAARQRSAVASRAPRSDQARRRRRDDRDFSDRDPRLLPHAEDPGARGPGVSRHRRRGRAARGADQRSCGTAAVRRREGSRARDRAARRSPSQPLGAPARRGPHRRRRLERQGSPDQRDRVSRHLPAVRAGAGAINRVRAPDAMCHLRSCASS